MTVLLQISDPHFGTERLAVVAALLRLIEATSPELVVVSGDITQRAPASVRGGACISRHARRHADARDPRQSRIPLFDPIARLFRPYANHRRAFGADLEPSFESDELMVLGVNTTRAVTVERWDYAQASERFELIARHDLLLDGVASGLVTTPAG